MQTGQIIAALRTRANMTQEQLAEALFVSRDLVSKWETGKRAPDYRTVQQIAALFAANPDEILPRDTLMMQELAACIPETFGDDSAAFSEALNRFLGTLNVRDRSVFLRRYYYQEEPAEIGTAYGIRENYVRTVLMRVRKKLKKYLKEEL